MVLVCDVDYELGWTKHTFEDGRTYFNHAVSSVTNCLLLFIIRLVYKIFIGIIFVQTKGSVWAHEDQPVRIIFADSLLM